MYLTTNKLKFLHGCDNMIYVVNTIIYCCNTEQRTEHVDLSYDKKEDYLFHVLAH